MPTYEYKREDGTTFEVFQQMSEEPLKVCPTTGQPVKRLISGGTGLLFKGSGFYVTDYKNGNGGSRSNGNGSTKSEGAAKSPESGETNSGTSDSKESKVESKKETD